MNFMKSMHSPFLRWRRSHKRQNSFNPDNENHNADAVAGPSNEESPPKIFQLNIDCFNELFEYLCVKDLYSFGQTCKRMNKVADEYFKQNYKSATKYCKIDGTYMNINHEWLDTSGFNQFTPYVHFDCPLKGPLINLYTNDNRPLQYIQSHINVFKSTNHIQIVFVPINSESVKHFKQLLPQLEIVQISRCQVYGDLYDLIFKHCNNLKEIRVERLAADARKYHIVDAVSRKWLLQKYPKLERLELMPSAESCRIEELREFFVRNPNVQIFTTTTEFLWENRNILLNSNVKLDILEIVGFGNTYETLLELLNQLHEQGFYKRLYLRIFGLVDENTTELVSLKGLELLCIEYGDLYNLGDLAQLNNLRELCWISEFYDPEEILAKSLTKLERLQILGTIYDIMPFIRRSPKLNKIKLILRSDVVLNLEMLNAERAKLAGARKITIYTHDNVFLATKWSTRNGDTNLRFIQMRREDSCVWGPRRF